MINSSHYSFRDIGMKNKQQPFVLKSSNNKLWLFVTLLSFAILLTLAYKFKGLLQPSVNMQESVDADCDLRKGACTTVLSTGGKVSFFINPIDIPLLKPLKLSVVLEGVDASKVEVDFVGIGMEMGYNRSLLTRESDTSGSVLKFTGKAILPVCSLIKMKWQARVLLHKGSVFGDEIGDGVSVENGVHLIPFQFFTIK